MNELSDVGERLIVKDLAILVVDDTRFGRAIFQSVLSKAGYTDIRLADGADEAINMMRERRADVVIADWFMPGMTGLELTYEVRQLNEESDTYSSVILCTAQEGVTPLVTAFRRGVDDFIRKPFDHEELVARVYAAGNSANLHNMLLETTARLSSSNHQLSQLSMIDQLTGLGNQAYFDKQLQSLISEFSARGGGVCCAVLSIDEFKLLSQAQNKPDMDQILLSVAKRILHVLRPTDISCRLGDSEFGVVLHYPEVANFRPTVFDRLQNDIHERPYRISKGELQLSVSIGACFLEDFSDEPSAEKLLSVSRKQLDAAQKLGRNQRKY